MPDPIEAAVRRQLAAEERELTAVRLVDDQTAMIAALTAKVNAVSALARAAMKLPTPQDPRPADDRVSPRAILFALGEWPAAPRAADPMPESAEAFMERFYSPDLIGPADAH